MELGAVKSGYGTVEYPYSAKAGTKQAKFETKIAALRESSYMEDTRERLPKIDGKHKKTIGYQNILQERIQELSEKIQNGETEPSYQIGAQSFSLKEWDEFLAQFDSVEEDIKEQTVTGNAGSLLTTESSSCTYPTADPKKDDIRYITWYTEEGIFCRKAGQAEGYEWTISFENKEQYDKVMEFVGQFPPDWNLRFAAHENFWTDFLNDEIDVNGFMKFMEGTNKGIPDYSITKGDSMYIDKEKIQWAKYLNPLGFKVYTGEEFMKQQAEIIAANREKFSKITDSYDV